MMKKLLALTILLVIAMSNTALAHDMEYRHHGDYRYEDNRGRSGDYDGHHRRHCDRADRYDYDRGCRW